MGIVRVRDAQTHQHIDLPGDTVVLRVPWEVSNVRGPCVVQNDRVTYFDTMGEHVARTAPSRLGDCRPGDNVLLQYEESTRADPRIWWLCDVEAINGDDAVGR
jgi:hypothetical protein